VRNAALSSAKNATTAPMIRFHTTTL
jgi:hypothetical protein